MKGSQKPKKTGKKAPQKTMKEKKADKRAGRDFEENGMHVYDVEVLEVRILDEAVQALLEGAQRDAIVSEVGRKREELRLLDAQATEAVNRGICVA